MSLFVLIMDVGYGAACLIGLGLKFSLFVRPSGGLGEMDLSTLELFKLLSNPP